MGCEVCNFTGYRGRTAIHELLNVTDHIREIILSGGRVPRCGGRRAPKG